MWPEAADEYWLAKRNAKTQAWEKFAEAMEADFRMASRKFLSAIRWLRRGKQCTTDTVYSGGGVVMTSTPDIVSRWGEYFKDLLKSTNMPSLEETESGDSQ